MMLIEQEDVVRLGMDKWTYPFMTIWEVGSPEAVAADYADVLAEGPFLCVVTDEDAWAGQREDRRDPAHAEAGDDAGGPATRRDDRCGSGLGERGHAEDSDANSRIPSENGTAADQPSSRRARSEEAVMWRTSPRRYWPVTTGAGPS